MCVCVQTLVLLIIAFTFSKSNLIVSIIYILGICLKHK